MDLKNSGKNRKRHYIIQRQMEGWSVAMNLPELSQTIRKVRLSQGMTVDQLAQKSGFSKGFISQIENFRITPSLKALIRIAEALGIQLSRLFDEKGQNTEYTFGSLNSGEEIQRDDNQQHGMKYLALAYRQIGRKMDPFLLEYTPAEPRGFMLHDTEEFFILLEGELEFYLYDDSNVHLMKPGDTLYMRANIPHRVVLAGSCTYAKAITVYSDSMGGALPK